MRFRFGREMRSRESHEPSDPIFPGQAHADSDYATARPDGGLVERYVRRRAFAERQIAQAGKLPPIGFVRAEPIGRGTIEHSTATGQRLPETTRVARWARRNRRLHLEVTEDSLRQRLIAATLAVVICFATFAGAASAHQRGLAQPGGKIEGIAFEYGVASGATWPSTVGGQSALFVAAKRDAEQFGDSIPRGRRGFRIRLNVGFRRWA